MKKLALFGFVLMGCASTPRSEFNDHAMLQGFTVEQVRGAARIVLEEVAHPQSVVRATDDRVLTEGRIGVCGQDVACGGRTLYITQNGGTPWTTIEVRMLGLGEDTAVKVEIDYESTSHCRDRYVDVSCHPEQLGTTGALEHRIIERIRARLERKYNTAEIVLE